jgi:hypothetical protein
MMDDFDLQGAMTRPMVRLHKISAERNDYMVECGRLPLCGDSDSMANEIRMRCSNLPLSCLASTLDPDRWLSRHLLLI